MRRSQAVLGLRHSILSSEIAYCSTSTSSILTKCTAKAPIAVSRPWRGTPVTSSSRLHHSKFSTLIRSSIPTTPAPFSASPKHSTQKRLFSHSRILQELAAKSKDKGGNDSKVAEIADEVEVQEFGRSEKASRAAQINLRAKLQRSDKNTSDSGISEIWRLIKIARPEAKWLSG